MAHSESQQCQQHHRQGLPSFLQGQGQQVDQLRAVLEWRRAQALHQWVLRMGQE
jgi:hypothetical protein